MTLREALRAAVVFGDFTLTSGESVEYVVDVPSAVLAPEPFAELGSSLAAACAAFDAGAVGGVLTGGALAATAVVPHGVPAFAIRQEPKPHGLGGRLVGVTFFPVVHEQVDVLILDDVLTTGDSLLRGALAARNAGFEVRGALAVVSRSAAATERVEGVLGVPCRALVRAEDLLGSSAGRNSRG